MAYFNYKTSKTVYFPAKDLENGWFEIDCGCSGGVEWGLLEPIECRDCGGSGTICWHKKSRMFAMYPGGPFKGRGDLTETNLNGSS